MSASLFALLPWLDVPLRRSSAGATAPLVSLEIEPAHAGIEDLVPLCDVVLLAKARTAQPARSVCIGGRVGLECAPPAQEYIVRSIRGTPGSAAHREARSAMAGAMFRPRAPSLARSRAPLSCSPPRAQRRLPDGGSPTASALHGQGALPQGVPAVHCGSAQFQRCL